MNDQVRFLRPSDLRQLSELVGGRKSRTFVLWHGRRYATGGHTELEFFNTDGAQKDFGNMDQTGIEHISNMISSGKADEPMLIQRIGVAWLTASDYVTATNVTDFMYVMNGGKFKLEINNNPVFECAPIGYLGSPVIYGGQASAGSNAAYISIPSNLKAPLLLDPSIFVEENVTIKGVYSNTEARTVTTQGWLTVYLIGVKYYKA